MKADRKSMFLYAVTDRSWLKGKTLPQAVEEAILGGATFVQLREKNIAEEEYISLAKEVKRVTDRYHVPFVIDDNVKVCLESGADGIHIGQSDMDACDVRKLIGEDKIMGVSARTLEQAKRAEAYGADYLGVGAVFSTSTKLDAKSVTVEELKNITSSVTIPVVAIGGITHDNVDGLSGSGIDGVAVVSALFARDDIEAAARKMAEKLRELVR